MEIALNALRILGGYGYSDGIRCGAATSETLL